MSINPMSDCISLFNTYFTINFSLKYLLFFAVPNNIFVNLLSSPYACYIYHQSHLL